MMPEVYRQARKPSGHSTPGQFFGVAGERRISQPIEALGIAPKSLLRTLGYLCPYHVGHSLNKLCDSQFHP